MRGLILLIGVVVLVAGAILLTQPRPLINPSATLDTSQVVDRRGEVDHTLKMVLWTMELADRVLQHIEEMRERQLPAVE